MATSKIDTRPMGYAVSKLFKYAYATYRENMYRVELIENGDPIFLYWDTYNRMKQRLRLLDPDTFAGLALPTFQKPTSDQEQLKYFQEFSKQVQIHEMGKVVSKLSSELESFICENCNRFVRGIHSVAGVNKFMFKCPDCGFHLSQAPILTRSKQNETRHDPPMVTYIRALKKKCPHCNQDDWLGLSIMDPEQPMGSLTRVCMHCKEPVELLQTYKYGYKPQEPTENLTKGITVSLANAEDLKPIPNEEFLNKEMCRGIFYSDKITVWQVTWGYKLGQYENIRYKTFPNKSYYGRTINTQGIIIELDPKMYKAAKDYLGKLYVDDVELYNEFLKDMENTDPETENLQIKRWVLHTLKHALLVYMPFITGLPTQEFSGSYDLDNNRVIIYDNQDGGIGGCQKLWKDANNLIDLFDLLTSKLEECDCRNKCPKCIVLDNCGEVNQALNRHLLVPLFNNIETFYD